MKHEIGEVVLVTHVYRRSFGEKGHRSWCSQPLREPRPAWVVGRRRLQIGRRVAGYWDEPSHFVQESTIPVVLVLFWPTQKPVPVPEDTLGHTAVPPYYMSAAERQMMRDDFKTDPPPRDEKGRFL